MGVVLVDETSETVSPWPEDRSELKASRFTLAGNGSRCADPEYGPAPIAVDPLQTLANLAAALTDNERPGARVVTELERNRRGAVVRWGLLDEPELMRQTRRMMRHGWRIYFLAA